MKRAFGSLFLISLFGTLVAQAAGVAYLLSTGKLTREKTFRIIALIHDVELQDSKQQQAQSPEPSALYSLEDLERARKIKSRDLELKAQSLDKSLQQVTFERGELAKDKDRYVLLKNSFEQRLKELQEETGAQGYANVRLVLENINPKKAKEQILKMVEAGEMQDVVHILAEMPIGKRAKIVSQFATEEEQEVLDKLLRQIRQGGAVSALIDDTRDDARLQ